MEFSTTHVTLIDFHLVKWLIVHVYNLACVYCLNRWKKSSSELYVKYVCASYGAYAPRFYML